MAASTRRLAWYRDQNQRRNPPRNPRPGRISCAALLCLAAWPAGALDFGPGPLGPITVTSGSHRVVGDTQIVFTPATATENGVRVTGATSMEIDADLLPITITSNGSPAISTSAVLASGASASISAHGNYSISNNNQGTTAPTSAVAASSDATITLNGGKVSHTKTNNNAAYQAALMASSGASVIATDVTVEAINTLAGVASGTSVLTFGVASSGAGSTMTVTGGTITGLTPNGANGGARVYGASAEAGGVTTLTDVDVFTGAGTRDHGAVPAGGTINIDGGSINVSGVAGAATHGNVGGLYSSGANGTSTFNVLNAQINSSAFGVFLQSNGGGFETNGLQQTNGGSSDGNLTQANLCDTVIDVGRSGLLVTARNRTVTASGVTITAAKGIDGSLANEAGVFIIGGGRVELSNTCAIGGTGGPNEITAVTGHGVHVTGINSGVSSTFVAGSALINVAADNEYGVNITAGGRAELTNTNIHTTGADAYGVRLDGATSAAQLGGGNVIATEGAAAHGFVVTNAANKTFDGGAGNALPAFNVQGNGSAMRAALGAATPTTPNTTLTLSGVTLSNAGGASHPGTIGVLSEGASASVTLTNATIGMAGAGSLTALARASAIDASGATLTAADGAHGVRLENGSAFTATAGTKIEAPPDSDAFQFGAGANSAALNNSQATGKATTASGASALTLAGGSVWTMTGDSNVTTLNIDNSRITYSQPVGSRQAQSSYKKLTLNHLNGNGGVIELHAWLSSDGSPSDRLIIAPGGSVTGTTTLRLPQLDIDLSPGALTTGNGILMVDVPNSVTMPPGAFKLETGPITIGGHTYTLEQGGVGAPNSWFLRSGPIINAGGAGATAIPALSGPMLAALALLLAAVAALRRRIR
jgi:hypothetical protein